MQRKATCAGLFRAEGRAHPGLPIQPSGRPVDKRALQGLMDGRYNTPPQPGGFSVSNSCASL